MKRIEIDFGLNRVSPNFYGGWEGWLAGCINDAQNMAELSARAGMQSRALFDEDCTIERFTAEFDSAAQILGEGDAFVATYSGHGYTEETMANTDRQGICLFNGQLAESAIRSLLANFHPGVRIVLIFDSCYAGGLPRDRRAVRVKRQGVKATRTVKAEPVELAGAVLFMTASSAQETSLDGDKNGAYTGTMLETMDAFEKSGKHPSWGEWHDAIKRSMSINFAGQHPQLEEIGGLSIVNSEVFTFEASPLVP